MTPCVAVIAISAAFAAPAVAVDPGALDRGFGQHGKVVLTPSGGFVGSDFALQNDGKIVVAGYSPRANDSQRGDAVVLRLTKSGQLDPNFGTDGIARVPLAQPARITAVVVQADDKIVVVGGTAPGHVAIFARLGRDGLPDEGFGVHGVSALTLSDQVDLTDAAVQRDGKVVAVGGFGPRIRGGTGGALVMRLLRDGSLDPSFDGDGTMVGFKSGGSIFLPPVAAAVTLDRAGNALVGAELTTDPTSDPGQAVIRLPANASDDARFVTHTWPNFQAVGTDVAVVSDGRVLVSGTFTMPSGSTQLAVSVFSPALHFAGTRSSTLKRTQQAVGLAPVPGGGAVALSDLPGAGLAVTRFAGARLSLDKSFGSRGHALIHGNGSARGRAVLSQRDGRVLVLAGTSSSEGASRIFLARLRGGHDKHGPKVRVSGIPGRCVDATVRLTVVLSDDSPIGRVDLLVDGKRVKSAERRRFVVRVTARHPGRTHRLTVVARDVAGNTSRLVRRWRTCG